MDIDEAKKVARVVEVAEGGCGGCINEATRELNDQFPEFNWLVVNPEGFHASIDVTYRPGCEPAPVVPRRTC